MKILVDLLSGPRSQHACEMPLIAGEEAPNTIIKSMTLNTFVQDIESTPLAAKRLAPNARNFELSLQWFDKMFASAVVNPVANTWMSSLYVNNSYV